MHAMFCRNSFKVLFFPFNQYIKFSIKDNLKKPELQSLEHRT